MSVIDFPYGINGIVLNGMQHWQTFISQHYAKPVETSYVLTVSTLSKTSERSTFAQLTCGTIFSYYSKQEYAINTNVKRFGQTYSSMKISAAKKSKNVKPSQCIHNKPLKAR
jgi:hypothetical protein